MALIRDRIFISLFDLFNVVVFGIDVSSHHACWLSLFIIWKVILETILFLQITLHLKQLVWRRLREIGKIIVLTWLAVKLPCLQSDYVVAADSSLFKEVPLKVDWRITQRWCVFHTVFFCRTE